MFSPAVFKTFPRWLCRWLGVGVGLLVCHTAVALDSDRQVTQYGHDSWNFQNGLPGGAVYHVAQLEDGYLWLRQAGGLLRFDGIRFSRVIPRRPGHPPIEDLRAAGVSADGRLLIRGPLQTLYLDRGVFTEAAPPTRLDDGFDRVIFQSRDGTIWIGADSNIHRFRDGKLEPVVIGTGWVTAFCEDRSGNLWIGAATGLYRLRDERLSLFPTGFNENAEQPFLPRERVEGDVRLVGSPTVIIEDHRGVIWVGAHDGLYKVIDGRLVRDEETRQLQQLPISALLEDAHHNLWIGTDGQGLFRLTGGVLSHLSTRDRLSDDGIMSLFEDREGSLWIGTRSGLDRLRDTAIATFARREGLSHDNAVAVTEGAGGEIYVFTFGGGITVMKDGAFQVLDMSHGLGSNHAGTLFVDSNGTLWAGTDRGLYSLQGDRFVPHPDDGMLGNSYISAITEDERGLILGTSQLQLYRYRDGVYSPYDLAVPQGKGRESARYVYATHRDAEGNLWFGMTAGLWKVPAGSPPEKVEPTAYREPVHTLFDDGTGFLWISGPDVQGFTRLRKSDGQRVDFGPDSGVPAGDIGRIITDRENNLWMGTRSGIIRIARSDVDDYAAGRISSVRIRTFGVVDGMKTEECVGSDQQPSAWSSRDGKLYLGTRKGIVVVDPERIVRNTRIPPVVVEELVVNGQSQSQPEGSVLEPGADNVEINYTALSLRSPAQVGFRYMLSGYDRDWVDAGTRRTAYYTHLRPGRYQFKVIASNEDGVWNETGATLSFTVKPHFWETVWFWFLSAAALILAAVGLHRFRVRRLRRREAELVATVDERTSKLRAEIAEHTEARRELQKYREYLEQLVAERTTALQTSNEQLQREITERRHSEDRYRSFFDDDLAAAFISTPSGRLVTYNPSFARLFHLKSDTESSAVHLTSLLASPDQATDLLFKLQRTGRMQDHELDMKRADGVTISVVANLVANFSPRGELVEVKGYLVDTTERKRLENQLRQSQKMEAIGQLAGGVAHDFNNLLTAIIGSTECIIEDAQDLPEIARLARDIREAGQRAAALTRQLLAFSRKQVLQPKIILLNDVVSEMETMLRRLLGEDVNLKLKLADDLKNVRADPNQMQQVVLNLTVNARDAMPRGGLLAIETRNVHLTEAFTAGSQSVPPGTYVCLSVRDSGTGMSPDVQAHIFEPFFTTKGVGKGTGLGLSTVYGIVQQSSGYIAFTSAEGQGTVFSVFLPAAADLKTPAPSPGTQVPFAARGETILIAEDNELVLGVARRCLQQYGFTVLDAANATEALERCRAIQGRIDLLVTDMIMPDMNGRELAERVLSEYPGIKILYMSGYTGEALGRVGGLDDELLLEKPFTAESLIRHVRKVLDGATPRTFEGDPSFHRS